ncbi:Transcriptional enhancer factor TEF-1 isoform X5 [Aix galericulata]|nr:Transcriptional enhancer factor TEF-1 isoform X5 [Aix galericulata]
MVLQLPPAVPPQPPPEVMETDTAAAGVLGGGPPPASPRSCQVTPAATRRDVAVLAAALHRRNYGFFHPPHPVSSHIQVLARRKSRDFHSKLKESPVANTAMSFSPSFCPVGLRQFILSLLPPDCEVCLIIRAQATTFLLYKTFLELKVLCASRILAGHDSNGAAWILARYNKHLFVHIGHANHSYSDPLLESVDIRQIYDKFPEKKGGLKELFGKGPQNAFFLVKFWYHRDDAK